MFTCIHFLLLLLYVICFAGFCVLCPEDEYCELWTSKDVEFYYDFFSVFVDDEPWELKVMAK